MFGKNPVSKREDHSGETLMVRESFFTLQGEGPFTGRPAWFVRLGGCHLQCSFCDTDFDLELSEERRVDALLENISGEVLGYHGEPKLSGGGPPLIVITGGEPMRQPISRFVCAALEAGFTVQIETSGSFTRRLPFDDDRLSIVCSPKTSMVHPELVPRVDAWKYIIGGETSLYVSGPNEGLPVGVFVPGKTEVPIYYQPMDVLRPDLAQLNIERCAKLALSFNRRLSVQVHKIAGVR